MSSPWGVFYQKKSILSNDCGGVSIAPNAVKFVFVQFRVGNRVADVTMAQVVLHTARIDLSDIGQVVPAGMAEHVRIDLDLQARPFSRAGDQLVHRGTRQPTTARTGEDVWRILAV